MKRPRVTRVLVAAVAATLLIHFLGLIALGNVEVLALHPQNLYLETRGAAMYGPLAWAFSAATVALVGLTLRLERGREDRFEPLALVAAGLTVLGVQSVVLALWSILGWSLPTDSYRYFRPAFALLTVATVTAGAALVRIRQRPRSRGRGMAWGALALAGGVGFHIWSGALFPTISPPDRAVWGALVPPMSPGSQRHPAYHYVVPSVIELDVDGTMRWEGETIRRGDEPLELGELRAALERIADGMAQEYDNYLEVSLPDDLLWIRADQAVPFEHVELLVREASRAEIGIWKLCLETRIPAPYWRGRWLLFGPKDGGSSDATQLEHPPIELIVEAAGSRLDALDDAPWSGSGPYRLGGERVLRYRIGDAETTDLAELGRLLDAASTYPSQQALRCGPGVVLGDVTQMWDALFFSPGGWSASVIEYVPLEE